MRNEFAMQIAFKSFNFADVHLYGQGRVFIADGSR